MSSGRRVDIAGVASVLCSLIGATVLVGWTTDSDTLRTFTPRGIMMLPNTAVAFLVGGVALWFLRKEDAPPRAARIAAGFVFLLGFLTFLERVAGWSFGIDMLLFP